MRIFRMNLGDVIIPIEKSDDFGHKFCLFVRGSRVAIGEMPKAAFKGERSLTSEEYMAAVQWLQSTELKGGILKNTLERMLNELD